MSTTVKSSAEHACEKETSQTSDVGTVGEAIANVQHQNGVFQTGAGSVDFCTVGWPMATIIFLKLMFATGVLSIPKAMYRLGAVGGALSVLGWGGLNTYTAYILGSFRNNHKECHTVIDMAFLVGGPIIREIVSVLYLVGFILATGSGILGVSIALDTLSSHAACTVWWSFLGTIVVICIASIRTFHNIGWVTWVGFCSIFVAVLVVVVGVTVVDRPAAAPQTGDYELGYYAIAHPTFIAGMTASATIFSASSGTCSFVPVIAEMKHPKDYKKTLFICMAILNACYLSFSLVVYRWCGGWVADPSLGSAGPVFQKVAYGIGLIGLLVSACLYLHVGAKYLFVRILRKSKHLQSNTVVHWATWISCTSGLGLIAFVLAEAIPIFNYILALIGSVCFGPIALILPPFLWFYDHAGYMKGTTTQKLAWGLHVFIILVGLFLCVAGTYSTVKSIADSYSSSTIGKLDNAIAFALHHANSTESAFSCTNPA